MKTMKLIIHDSGDPSVGISPVTWQVDCPFLSDTDIDDISYFDQKMTEVYGVFAEGKITTHYQVNED